ncbi:deoxyribodipyrimidine photo-lyase-like [Rhagoletis pomonella]|uniref:deoxyribodipyrimidine photo-lyase-like n=1 Tax=Rhagoletis pomonella TaxID=28610 RepID=UPI00177F7F6C|nr:deoxyribodipyrimidine photo-lyase-like [Rhagoletis pomonella]XP_036331740.1 deoxyribodipyrimidine photo-lyase-like [Rhagoletis pomonella]XP_036331741.1 deoxyribodipyrimidine photo-lyase-like [Rhagoletis pomonella]
MKRTMSKTSNEIHGINSNPSSNESDDDETSDVEAFDHTPSSETDKRTSHIISPRSLQQRRLDTARSISEFHFIKKRVRVLSSENKVSESRCGGVLYWMSRDARVQDNWALLFAQRLALKFELPFLIAFCLNPGHLNTTLRQYEFLMGGLEEVECECRKLSIPFHLLIGQVDEHLSEMVRLHNISAVVCDFNPLREAQLHVENVKKALPVDVPFTQVDAHNVVPLWVTSDKQEFVPFFMRRRINSRLEAFLTEFPPVTKHPHNKCVMNSCISVDWKAILSTIQCDRSVKAVEWAKPGYRAACLQLQSFCTKRLRFYNEKRNDPTIDAQSGLSPWFHFGQISVQRCILEVMRYTSKFKASVETFCDAAIIYRELADNFCYYNENYDNLKGLYGWAIKTLDEHRTDERNPSYTLSQFEQAHTHDDLWNAAQIQLANEGKMHGFLRMYWAKKILEWAATPEQALEIAIYLNDKYSLDGRDPNGYVGCMWAIGGLHDGGYRPRPIFGKVRYMNYKGCQRKFDVAAFVARYDAEVHE